MKRLQLHIIPLICTLIVLPASALDAYSQRKDPNLFRHEISAGTGIGTSFRNGSPSDATVWLNYSHYYDRHLGARFGLQYMPSNMNIDDFVALPLAFSVRTGMRTPNDAITYGTLAAMDLLDAFVWGNDNIVADMLAAFILTLISRAEAFVGITPGYIFGDSAVSYYSYAGLDGNIYNASHGVLKTRSLYCSADFGVNLSWRIWRFTINLTPAVHWNFLDNFHIYSSTDEGGRAQDASVPMHFTMNFGLGFLF